MNVIHYRRPSTYIALVVWGTTGFMAQPTIASFLVHFFGVPAALFLTVWLAHWEGRNEALPSFERRPRDRTASARTETVA